MSRINRALSTSVAVVALTIGGGDSAYAFGPICIPVMANCFCTFAVPCPVTDPLANAQEALRSARLADALKLMNEFKNPQQALLKALTGELGGFGIPGLNAVGIDINGLMSGDLTSLGLPDGVMKLAKGLDDIGVDAQMLGKIAKGEVSPTDFLTVATNAGLDLSALEEAGISRGMIDNLARGNVNPSDLLSIATGMAGKADFLKEIGIDSTLLSSIASGSASPDELFGIAERIGLDTAALGAAGLDKTTILQIASGKGPEAIVGMLQNAGLDTSPLTALGIDTEVLSGIASGALPSSAIASLAASAGIDPSAIVIPGVDGPISLPSGRLPNPGDMISIPVDQIPGLDRVLAGARGESLGAAATAARPGSSSLTSAAMCTGAGALISVTEPPNEFGTDMGLIDMQMTAGGSLRGFEEAQGDTIATAQDTAISGFARGVQIRPVLQAALNSVETFETMMGEAKSLKDDYAVNDAIATQLLTARAETASLLSTYASIRASATLTPSTVKPIPLLPNGSTFQAAMQSAIAENAMPASRAAEDLHDLAKDHAEFVRLARNALTFHNAISATQVIEATLSGVISTIDDHEAQKTLLVGLEGQILGHLGALYGDPLRAWNAIRPQLQGAAGTWFDGDKWRRGRATSDALSARATAQAGRTQYGERLRNPRWRSTDDGDSGPEYAIGSQSASSYPSVERYFDGRDTFKIIKVASYSREGDSDTDPSQYLTDIFQFYMEMFRREQFAAELRRGDSSRAMTSYFWTEMRRFAPDCLVGPLTISDASIDARPELFDLGKNCGHLVWTDGDEGDYISASALGGADGALWMSKIVMAQTEAQTGGRAKAMESASIAKSFAFEKSIMARSGSQGLPSTAQHTSRIMAALDDALADASFVHRIDFPKEAP